MLGWEHVSIESNTNPFLRLAFDSYPISHGLIAVVGWATLFASLYFAFARYVQGAIVIWIGVVSHWLLDYVVHRPDLPLYAGSRLFGLGLWNHCGLVIAIELAMFVIAIWVYLKQTRAKDKIGDYAFWGFIVLLLAVYALAIFGPAPPTVNKLAIHTLSTWLLVLWAWWFDKHREVTSQ